MLSLAPAAWLDSYRQDLKTALQTAAGDGFRELHANTARGELNPRAFSSSARRHLARSLRDLGVRLDALAVEFPGLGLADPQDAEQRLDQLRHTLALCSDLQVRRATATLSGFHDEKSRDLAREVLGAAANLADRAGVALAIHAGADEPALVGEQLRRLDCPALSLAFDAARAPAACGSSGGLTDLMGVVYLRDIRRRGAHLEEVPFGQGEVDFPRLLATLAECPAPPVLVVRRDVPGGVDAMRQGREYIRSLLGRRTPR